MAIFQTSHNRRSKDEALRFTAMTAPSRPRLVESQKERSARTARVRGESSPAAGPSLTVAFLIAGAIIVGSLTFWSGPDQPSPGDFSMEQPNVVIPAP